jgi:hypothetical protein
MKTFSSKLKSSKKKSLKNKSKNSKYKKKNLSSKNNLTLKKKKKQIGGNPEKITFEALKEKLKSDYKIDKIKEIKVLVLPPIYYISGKERNVPMINIKIDSTWSQLELEKQYIVTGTTLDNLKNYIETNYKPYYNR